MPITEWLSPKEIEYRRDNVVITTPPHSDEDPNILAEMLIEAYRFIAKLPCPVHRCTHGKIYNSRASQVKYGEPAEEVCPRCGKFEVKNRGKFAENWKDAAIKLKETLIEKQERKAKHATSTNTST
jgi:superfamily II helicase